jgi:hypothetical protein
MGVPGGALGWYYTQVPALSLLKTTLDNKGVLIAWDKPEEKDAEKLIKGKQGKKIYGVFPNYETLWNGVEKLPGLQRYGYELIPSGRPCKAYWDLEFCVCDLLTRDCVAHAKEDVQKIMGEWLKILKENVKKMFNVKCVLCVLDGTRFVNEEKLQVKFSFHVIVCNLVFVTNQCKMFKKLRSEMPTLYQVSQSLRNRGESVRYGPSEQDTCAPDMSVWKENQVFRFLSCSKRGSSTPLGFANAALADQVNALDTFLCNVDASDIQEGMIVHDVSIEEGDPSHQGKKKRKKRDKDFNNQTTTQDERSLKNPRVSFEDAEEYDDAQIVDYVLKHFPAQIKNIQEQVQCLLCQWKDENTVVDKLVRAKKNLRFQCRLIEKRPCIFSEENHESNNPLIWLDAPYHVNEGELAHHYSVIYNCKSSECMCQGLIGEIVFNVDRQVYECKMIFPARIFGNRGPVKSTMRKSQAVIHGNWATHVNEDEDDAGGLSSDEGMEFPEKDDFAKDETPSKNHIGDFFEETTFRVRDLIQEKIIGLPWSLREMKTFGSDKTYLAVKRKMEKSICKICRPHVMFLSFVEKSHSKVQEYHHYTYDNMAKNIKNVFYYKKSEPLENPSPARFFPAWTDDPFSRSYENLIFDPSPDNIYTGKNDLNVWPGFLAESLAPLVPEQDNMMSLIEPILYHMLHVLADENQQHCDWLLDWMANLVQRPHLKTQVPIVFSGKQGVGKGIIFDFFRENVLGLAISAQIQNPAQDLFSRFANKHVNKLFLQIDEGEGMAKFADQMKNIITATHLNYEIKGLQPLTAVNFLNIIITTNHDRPVLVETSDRRYALFKASDKFLKTDHYYETLGIHLKENKVARAFFDYLKTRDLSKYSNSFQSSRPITDYYVQSRKSAIPILQKFLSSLIRTERYYSSSRYSMPSNQRSENTPQVPMQHSTPIIVECSASMLFKDFTRFQENGKYQSTMTQTTFFLKLKSVQGISKKNSFGVTTYVLDYTVIYESLMQNNEFDEDAFIE